LLVLLACGGGVLFCLTTTGVRGEDGGSSAGADAIFRGMVNDESLKMAEYDVNNNEMSSLGTLRVGAKTMLTLIILLVSWMI